MPPGFPLFRRDTLLVRPLVDDDTEGNPHRQTHPDLAALPAQHSWGEAPTSRSFDGRAKDYVAVKPPAEIAELILERPGHWTVPAGQRPPDGAVDARRRLADPQARLRSGDPSLSHRSAAAAAHPRPADQGRRRSRARAARRAARRLQVHRRRREQIGGAVRPDHADRPAGARRVPLHGITSPDIGGGKSYLVRIAAVLATGMAPAAITLGKDETEAEKRLGATLIGGSSDHPDRQCQPASSRATSCAWRSTSRR